MTGKLKQRLQEIEKKTPIKDDEDLKQALDKIMTDEVKKSLSKVDEKLITECVDMIMRIDKIDQIALAEKERETANKILKNIADMKQTKKYSRRFRRPVIVCIIVIIGSFIVMTATARGMGYDSIVDMGKALFKLPEKIIAQQNDKEMIYSLDSRSYDTVEDMVAAENLDIIYPRELPNGYVFENIIVVDFGDYLDVTLNSNENYIDMALTTNTTIQIAEYTDEINGIKYNIVNRNGLYEAYWNLDSNYYKLSCIDKEDLFYTISKIN